MHRALHVILLLGAILMSGAAHSARGGLPNYAISQPLGLTDSQHTAASGRRTSRVWFADGQYATGSSDGYKNNQTFGSSTWWSDGAQIVRLGFTGFDYTGRLSYVSGIQQSYPKGINSSGVTIGYSVRNPTDSYGFSGTPWMWDGSTLTELGPDGPGYRDSFNRKAAGVATNGINDAGDILGASGRYSNGQSIGTRPWVLRNAAYIPLGLTGGDYTMNGGYEYSEAYELNESGQVLGKSQRAGALSAIGWITDDGVNYDYVGLVTPENEHITPFDHSWPITMNEAGQAAGAASIFESSTGVQVDAVWFYDGLESRRVGLIGDEFTGDLTGFQRSELTTLTETGYLLGTSSLSQQTYGFGTATWVSDGTTTRRTGLWNAQHTRNDGWQDTSSYVINESGQSAGFSRRYNGTADLGATAWIDDGAATHIVGRYNAAHTRADGFQSSFVELLNEHGDAVGSSIRYTGSAEVGRTGWHYDAETGTLTDIFSTTASSDPGLGHAYVSFSHLGEDGTVVGGYQTFPGGGTTEVFGVFAWTPTKGLITFEDHVLAGLDDWDSLYSVQEYEHAGFAGLGATGPAANSTMAFRLTELAAADLNGDGRVDGDDLALILNNFGSTESAGDVTGDGAVDGGDFLA